MKKRFHFRPGERQMLLQIRQLFEQFSPEEWSHMTAQIEYNGQEYRVGKVIPQGRFHITDQQTKPE